MKYPNDLVNKVVCGNSLDIIRYIPDNMLDAVVIDPPYGEGMGYEGDDNVDGAINILSAFLETVYSKIADRGHIVVFWTMKSLDKCIDAVRSNGFKYRRTLSMYVPKGSARPYLGWLPRTQAIVVAQKYSPERPTELHYNVAKYLSAALVNSGMSRSTLSKILGCNSRLVMKWTRTEDPSWCLPTPHFYAKLKEILNLDSAFDHLLVRTRTNRTFSYHHDTYVVDEKVEKMYHPSQKPLSVISHIVSCVSSPGGLVLDGFCGSGTTALACKKLNINFIAIDVSQQYCDIALSRLYDSSE